MGKSPCRSKASRADKGAAPRRPSPEYQSDRFMAGAYFFLAAFLGLACFSVVALTFANRHLTQPSSPFPWGPFLFILGLSAFFTWGGVLTLRSAKAKLRGTLTAANIHPPTEQATSDQGGAGSGLSDGTVVRVAHRL